jgi:tRNA threonylcarbamoyl adenosine modification protein YjeE
MLSTTSGGTSLTLALDNEQATQRLVVDVANALEPGNMVTLSGDLGAGKTTFARALIRHLAGNPTISVPSPTFTLMQSYDLPRFPLVHADLYRLSSPEELAELGFDDLADDAVVLMEWPDRAAGFLPADRIDISFTLSPELGLEYRDVRVTGYGTLAKRVERIAALRDFLEQTGYAGAERRRLQGDASTRVYEQILCDGHSLILMNSPRRADGPPVRGNKPYSAIAHLAEDVKPFVAMANGLRERGFSAPEVLEADLDHGFLILEDLGSEPVVSGTPPAPIQKRYEVAVDTLLALHSLWLPEVLPVSDDIEHVIPRYSLDALLIEAELLLDWYIPAAGGSVTDSMRTMFTDLWRGAMLPVLTTEPTWVLRDYHSPNLLWLPEREGIQHIGLLDFQDAVIGPPAYDLASLLQDARVDVPETMELALLTHYCRIRKYRDPHFQVAPFAETYAILAAQRATKILGIFARLDRRDGKPQYLRHIPRIWGYLQRSLTHPSLASLQAWYRSHVPAYRPSS